MYLVTTFNVPTCALTQLAPFFYMSCLADGVSKDNYNRLMSSANDAKKRLEDAEKKVIDSDRKLRLLEKANEKVETELKATKAELVAAKVANDEYLEAEKAHQDGLTELQEELLS